jgi:hypothetical protein
MKTWLFALGAVIIILAIGLLAIGLSGFADVPCQDGIWDAGKHTCIPTHGA